MPWARSIRGPGPGSWGMCRDPVVIDHNRALAPGVDRQRRAGWSRPDQALVLALEEAGTPGRTRTDTEQILSLLPLPLGYWGADRR